MSSLSRELVILILQFLDEEKFKGTVHMLEKESGFYFNMKHFEDAVINGDWEEVENYIAGFTKIEDNRYSMKVFFEIRKQKYLEALDKGDRVKALDILRKDLKVFSTYNEDLYKEITVLLTLNNFRENEQLSKYGDIKSARGVMFGELKKLIEANPLFKDKLQFPTLRNSRLRTMINQSLNWQHQLCKNPKPNPDIRTLFVDHNCAQSNGVQPTSPVTNQLTGPVPRVAGFQPLNAHVPFQPAPASLNTFLEGWMTIPSSVQHPAISGGPISLSSPINADSENVLRRTRPFGLPEEVNNLPVSIFPATNVGQNHVHASYSSEDLPKTVVANLSQGSAVKSMDFHPVQQTLLLVGTNVGDIAVWDVCRRDRLAFRNFKVWDIGACSMTLQALLANEYTASVNRLRWSPDGALFGVAYSKHIVHVYSFHGGDDLRNHLEIDAHVGNVSDLAFSHPNKQLCIITCGDDKSIKVWDAVTGSKQYTFEGHEAAVYSVCPHQKESIQFIFSTSVDGKIKAWLYDNLGSRVDYDAPGQSCTTMAYSADGTRLFSCGTSKDGESHIVEWNESEGAVKRSYLGLSKRSMGMVHFDTTKNRFLVAGDEFVIKFWDMDNVNLLTITDANGGLPASPCMRFSKEGNFLAVSTSENGVKILANAEGLRLVQSMDNHGIDATAVVSGCIIKNGESQLLPGLAPRIVDEMEKCKIWKPTEISEQAQLRSLRLPDGLLSVRIIRLVYTHSGGAILALAYNAVHKLWRWLRNERNLLGKATTTVPPQLWQPASGILMTNDISDTNPEEAIPCFALSKNDSYVMSASGGKISLFNMSTFKTMTTFMHPPPAATFLAFHPEDNNIVAVGMEDSSIQIYNVRVDEIQIKLRGHHKRVTGLAFSNALNILVSAGADAQLFVWGVDRWEKRASKFLQIPAGRATTPLGQTRVQFHQDQTHVLAVHETQIAIYDTPKLDCSKQWIPKESSGAITDATYSCDCQIIYACFQDGSITILTSTTLRVRCRINPTAYLPSDLSSRVYPLVVAAHPRDPNQFALGLTDGGVQILEPLESDGKWGIMPYNDNGPAGPSTNPVAAGSDRPPSRGNI